MKVRYAAAVLSKSMHDYIMANRDVFTGDDYAFLAELCLKMDTIFDILNTSATPKKLPDVFTEDMLCKKNYKKSIIS